MITALHLGNFKAFGESQRLPIKPLTLVFGPNSSGKSSLIHGLLFARHAFETGDLNVTKTALGGDCVDLGGFGQYVHRRNLESRVRFGIDIRPKVLSQALASHAGSTRAISVSFDIGCEVDDKGQPVHDGKPQIVTTRIALDERDFVQMSRRVRKIGEIDVSVLLRGPDDPAPSVLHRIDRLDAKHPTVVEILSEIVENAEMIAEPSDQSTAMAEEVLQAIIAETGLGIERLLPTVVIGEASQSGPIPDLATDGRGDQRNNPRAALRLFLRHELESLLRGVETSVANALARLRYLGPLRSYPPRHLIGVADDDRNWIAGGGYAWDVVRRDKAVRDKINEWLSAPNRLQTPYRLGVHQFIPPLLAEPLIAEKLEEELGHQFDSLASRAPEPGTSDDEEEHLSEGRDSQEIDIPDIASQLVHFLADHRSIERWDVLRLGDLRTNTIVSHRDVGIGVSQVLPVLVHAYADREQIVAIEQPEIHLHPALQAELGDLFIESALGPNKNTFILETHSEHLILRILRRVRETTEGKLPDGHCAIRPEDVAVLYTQPSQHGVEVIELPVTPDGDFARPWPGGFFAERFQDLP